MKKLYLLFIPLILSFAFIQPKALNQTNTFNYIYSDIEISTSFLNVIKSKVEYFGTAFHSDSMWYWKNNYYLITYLTSDITYLNGYVQVILIDKTTGEINILSLNNTTGSVKFEHTNYLTVILNSAGTVHAQYAENGLIIENYNLFLNNNSGDQGLIIYSNVPTSYIDSNNNTIYLQNRLIPNNFWPDDHYMKTNDILNGNQIDSIVDTNLTSILDEFNIDLLFQNLESVLEQIYGFIESAFLSLNEVITYITSSLNNVVSFITANITIISIISMVYLALPSILRDLFTLALSTSVVFIMLRRFI